MFRDIFIQDFNCAILLCECGNDIETISQCTINYRNFFVYKVLAEMSKHIHKNVPFDGSCL